MVYTRIKYLLIFAFFALGVFFQFKFGLSGSWYFYVAGILLLATHFLFGTVGLAFSRLKKGRVDEAENLLAEIKKPEWLLKTHRSYYHFTNGMIALQKKNLESADQHLQEALQRGLRNDKDKALVTLNLAHIHLMQQKLDSSRSFLDKAKLLNTNDLLIKEKIKELEKIVSYPYN